MNLASVTNFADFTPEPIPSNHLNIPLRSLSASSINLFVSCPEAFRTKYILDRPEKMFGQRFMGACDHKTVEEVVSRIHAGVTVTRSDVPEIYKTTWSNLIEENGEVEWKDDDPNVMYERGLAMAQLYVDEVVPTFVPVEIEQKVEIEIDGIKVKGYIDLKCINKATGEIVIRERKTTGQKQAKPKSRWRFQGRLYQLMTGLPVQWDVVTRQVTPKIYTADMEGCEGLQLRDTNPEATISMVRGAATRMAYLMDTLGPDKEWPLDGYFSDWGCDYCSNGPKFGGWCSAWKT